MATMPVSADKVDWLIATLTSETVKIIMQERGLQVADAMRELASSRVYDALLDRETGLYLESPSYLYELVHLEASSTS